MPDINAAVAEWLIARFTERSRAASIVGDLLEATAKQGSLAFWFSIAGVVLAITWRHLTAFAAALLCLYLFQALEMPHRLAGHGLSVAVMRHGAWWPLFIVLASSSAFLVMAAPYAAISYGFRDRFAQLAVALFIPSELIYWFWSIPAAASAILVFAAGILIFALSFPLGRRALLALAIAGVLGYAGLRSTLYLSERYLEIASPSVTRTVVVQDSIPFFVVLAVTVACALMHHLLLSPKEQLANIPAAAPNS